MIDPLKRFVRDFAALEKFVKLEVREEEDRADISAILRRLLIDESPLAEWIAKKVQTPIIFLIPQVKSGNPDFDPAYEPPIEVLKFARPITSESHPGGTDGFFHKPYNRDEYLNYTQFVFKRRSFCAREIIKMYANKLGGVHLEHRLKDISEGGRGVDAKTIAETNRQLRFGGPAAISILPSGLPEDTYLPGIGAIESKFNSISLDCWRALAPLAVKALVLHEKKYPKD